MLEDDERCICGLWKKKWTKLWYYFQHQLILKIVALEMVVLYRDVLLVLLTDVLPEEALLVRNGKG